jgi:DNA-binding GntR family transcriptional regulator
MREMVAEHRLVVDALARRDPDGAEAALRHHLGMVLSALDDIRREHPDYFAS